MSNSLLHKAQKLLVEPQAAIGTGETPDSTSYIIPAEDITFELNRGNLNIPRSGLSFGFPGSVQHGRGSAGWTISFTTEVHDSDLPINPTLAPLLFCGLEANDLAGDQVFTISRECLLDGLDGTLPEGPGVGTIWLVETCGTTKRAKDVTGTATLTFEAGERLKIAYDLLGRVWGSSINDTVIPTTATEIGYGQAEDWSLPYVCTAMRMAINGVDPVNLQSVEIALNMDVSEQTDPLDPSGLGVVKPELMEYITVSFNVAQDSLNKNSFWSKYFDGDSISLNIEMDGPDGGMLTLDLVNLRHDAPATEDVNGRRHYGMVAHAFIRPSELDDPDAAFANLFRLVYSPPASS
jgi:hypothetical protein